MTLRYRDYFGLVDAVIGDLEEALKNVSMAVEDEDFRHAERGLCLVDGWVTSLTALVSDLNRNIREEL